MYHNLNPSTLGITGRQSELIELALTYGFGGLELDFAAVVKRARKSGRDVACRFVASAGIHGGGFVLPFNLAAQEAVYQSSLVELAEYAEVAAALTSYCCELTVPPVSEAMPYQENFELHRSRLTAVAEVLEKHGIRLGLRFQAAASYRQDAEASFIHTPEALLTLIRTIGSSNIGIALDTWDWFVGGGTLEQLLEMPAAQIVSVRLADVPADADFGTITEQQRLMPGETPQIDCRAIVQHLLASDYQGPVTLSPDPSQLAGMTRDAIVQLARATFNDLKNPNPPAPPEPVEPSGESEGEAATSETPEPATSDAASE